MLATPAGANGTIPDLADGILGACDTIHTAVVHAWRDGWDNA